MTAPAERTSIAHELAAMEKVWTILETLDHGARGRVLSWARDQATSEALADLAANSTALSDTQREQLEALAGRVRR